MALNNSTASEEHCSRHRTSSWDNKHSRVIVYDPLNHDLSFETEETLNSMDIASRFRSPLITPETDTSFKVHLPRWRNRVNIYLDDERKAGFVTSIDLGKLGVGKNLKRRLRYNYTVLHVKGARPRMPSGAKTEDAASLEST